MIKCLVNIFLVVSYFYIAIWIYENLSELLGFIFGFGVVGFISLIITEYYLDKKNKSQNND